MGGATLNITPDTNILVRAIVADDPDQTPSAQAALENASAVALTSIALCELAWVLRATYRRPPSEIAMAIRRLLGPGSVRTDTAAVEAGLAFLDAGGDFADGVIAQAGAQLGGTTFISFDRRALDIAATLGLSAATP